VVGKLWWPQCEGGNAMCCMSCVRLSKALATLLLPTVFPMSTSSHFCVSIAPLDTSMGSRLSVPPAKLCLDLGLVQSNVPATSEQSTCAGHPSDNPLVTAETPATSTRRGSFNYDWERGDYPMEWSDLAAFNAWCQEEELRCSIELILAVIKHRGPLWTERRVYVCSRQMSRGRKNYEKKNLGWHRKINSKKTGCHCCVTIKLYPHTDTILGNYINTHDHEISTGNIAYTQMSGVAWEQIRSMLVQRVDHKEIVRN